MIDSVELHFAILCYEVDSFLHEKLSNLLNLRLVDNFVPLYSRILQTNKPLMESTAEFEHENFPCAKGVFIFV